MTAYIMATMIQAGIALDVSLPLIMIFFKEWSQMNSLLDTLKAVLQVFEEIH